MNGITDTCMKKPWVLSYPLSAQKLRWSDWTDAQADLSLCWAHRWFCLFCRAQAQIVLIQSSAVSRLATWRPWPLSRYSVFRHSGKVQFLKGYPYRIPGPTTLQHPQPTQKRFMPRYSHVIQIRMTFPRVQYKIPYFQNLPSKAKYSPGSWDIFPIEY